MKKFDPWNELKKKLESSSKRCPYVSEGDIFWASIGENVGSEIGGKSSLFSRPVIILKKLAHDFYFVVPTTSKEKDGTWYSYFEHQGIPMNACLHQAKTLDYRRLSSKLGTLEESDLAKVKKDFHSLYA